MKLNLTIVGKSINEIEKAIELFIKELKDKQLDSNCFWPLNDENKTLMDYAFTNGTDVFNMDNPNDELVIHPYKGY